jgi:hypothetical protein
MKRVRQVSIVERAVAETERVTERPKKLNPLFPYELEFPTNYENENLPNADHDQNTGDSNRPIMHDLP